MADLEGMYLSLLGPYCESKQGLLLWSIIIILLKKNIMDSLKTLQRQLCAILQWQSQLLHVISIE